MITDKSIITSFITELELLAFPEISDDSENTIKGLLKNCTVIDITPEIKDLTIEFRRKSKLKLPDAIVAATAFFLKYHYLQLTSSFAK